MPGEKRPTCEECRCIADRSIALIALAARKTQGNVRERFNVAVKTHRGDRDLYEVRDLALCYRGNTSIAGRDTAFYQKWHTWPSNTRADKLSGQNP